MTDPALAAAHHVVAARFGVVALSLAAAFLYAVTSVLQHGATQALPRGRLLRPSLLGALVRQPRWLASHVVDAGAYVLQFLALRAGSLVAVETLLVTGLLFALPLGAAASHRRPQRLDWLATGAIVAGLGLFLVAARPVVGAGIVGLVAVAKRGPRPWRAPALGAASGALFAVTAALAKASGHLLDKGVVHALGSWQPYALAALAVVGVVLSQSAFYAGPLQASLPVLTITEPLVAGAIGLAAFHEHVATHGLRALGGAAAVIMLVGGIVGLSRSPLVAGADVAAEESRPR
jgi:hypothetical protein